MVWKADKTEFKLMVKIARRAERRARDNGVVYKQMMILTDLNTIHSHIFPLNLEALLYSDNQVFDMEIMSIWEKLDRLKCRLNNNFRLIYAKG
jgi:hypothetical protein